MKITKAVIPCGGMGSRYLPITKAVPKELLPIIDTPVVAHIVKEAADSGITDIMIILGNGKEGIKEYFAADNRLMDSLNALGRPDLADSLKQIACGVNITYAYQKEPKGSADAAYLAKSFTGSEPFCLAMGDDITVSETPVLSQLIDAFSGRSIVGVQTIETDDITRYGVAQLSRDAIVKQAKGKGGRLLKCRGFIEKPPLAALPSRYAALGRYIFTSEIYPEIEELIPVRGEYRLTDAINLLASKGRVHIYDFEGKRFDAGDRLGALKANIEFALDRDFAPQLKQYLKNLVSGFDNVY